ncbi:glycosyltransferase [Mucilaginibacter antarcticus]|uniref:glycosyltransferase n=1 Tax=Mucilaginibacter antarcticus TaxID=1855725 RepID=UPI003634D748
MDKVINLSYIITTRNRLPFLTITLQKLMNQLQPDEEIVVVDAQSTDGTQQYLEQLLYDGKIHQYLSEPDLNQAHGWNKAMLMAKGLLIKKIIDDDVFCYSAIGQCKTYMLQNPQVDVVISNDMSSFLSNHNVIEQNTRLPQFKQWQNGAVPSFTFGDVHMLIRRSALAYTGLYNTGFTMIDWEFALRLSYKKANIAYYTGYNALNVGHPQTVTAQVNKQLLLNEGKLGARLYNYAGDNSEMGYWSAIKVFIGNLIFKKNSPKH